MFWLVTVDNLTTSEIVRQFVYMGTEEACIAYCLSWYDHYKLPFHMMSYQAERS